jgi:hypothetical protein
MVLKGDLNLLSLSSWSACRAVSHRFSTLWRYTSTTSNTNHRDGSDGEKQILKKDLMLEKGKVYNSRRQQDTRLRLMMQIHGGKGSGVDPCIILRSLVLLSRTYSAAFVVNPFNLKMLIRSSVFVFWTLTRGLKVSRIVVALVRCTRSTIAGPVRKRDDRA